MKTAARIYVALFGLVVLFQCAVLLGAPAGHLTQGGFYQGSLPPVGRATAAASLLLLAVMAIVVLCRAGLIAPVWLLSNPLAIRVVLVISGLAAVMNLITPSVPERIIWGPVTLVMLACVLRLNGKVTQQPT